MQSVPVSWCVSWLTFNMLPPNGTSWSPSLFLCFSALTSCRDYARIIHQIHVRSALSKMPKRCIALCYHFIILLLNVEDSACHILFYSIFSLCPVFPLLISRSVFFKPDFGDTLAHKCTETHLLLMHSIWMDFQVILSMCVSYGSHRKWLEIAATTLSVMHYLCYSLTLLLFLYFLIHICRQT